MVVGMYSTFFIGVLYFQHVLGFDPVMTGLAFLPQTLMVAVMSSGITARIMRRLGPKTTALMGLVVVSVGLTLFVTSGPTTAYFPQIFAAVLLIGFGAAEAFTPLLTIALAGVPAKDAGIGSGIVNVSQQVSGALSVAVLGAVSAAHTASLLASGSSADRRAGRRLPAGLRRRAGQRAGGHRPRGLHHPPSGRTAPGSRPRNSRPSRRR